MHEQSISHSGENRVARIGQAMSRFRHDDPHPVRWFGLVFRGMTLEPPSARGWDRLVATRSGACVVRAAGLVATVTPEHGVVVADGVPLRIHAGDTVDVRMLYLRPSASRAAAPPARAVMVPPLLRELIERFVESGSLDVRKPRDRRVIELVLDEVESLATSSSVIALPADRRALRAAEHCLATIGALDVPLSARRLAAIAETSQRTLERRFRAETGLALGRWQRRLRLLIATRAIGAGTSVSDAAYDAGYATPSGFIAAFRREFGTTPTRYR